MPTGVADLSAIASLGCLPCKLSGYGFTEPELHHVRKFGGSRKKAPVIPLCPNHHRLGPPGVAVHAGRKVWAWDEMELVRMVKELLSVEPDAAQ
jgi:hypothetical protein